MLRRLIVIVLSGAVVAGCGAAPEDSQAQDEPGDSAAVESTQEALVSNCGSTLLSNAALLTVGTYPSQQVATVSPPYGTPACQKTAQVGLNHFSSDAGTTVAYAGPLPRNATDCAKIQVSQVTYDSFSNQLGSVTSKNGGWTGTECLYPITGSPRLTRGQHRELVQAIDQFGQIQPVRVTLFALP